jgi:hypothetical protein
MNYTYFMLGLRQRIAIKVIQHFLPWLCPTGYASVYCGGASSAFPPYDFQWETEGRYADLYAELADG